LAAIDGGATAAGTGVSLDAAIEKKASANNSDVRRGKNIARGLREEVHYTVASTAASARRGPVKVATIIRAELPQTTVRLRIHPLGESPIDHSRLPDLTTPLPSTAVADWLR
jgi:hypothetical protein